MAKTFNRKNEMWSDEYDQDHSGSKKERLKDRRKEKRVRSALLAKDIDQLMFYSEKD